MGEPIFICICEHCKREFDPDEMDNDLEYCSDCKLILNLENLTIQKDKKILSIDIGIKHLGLSYSLVDENYIFQKLLWINLIDITVFDCLPSCTLFHTNTLADRIAHVIHKYHNIFNSSDIILIEQQPPLGIVALEQLIFSVYREKAFLISPVSVHKHFGMRNCDYETRKKMSVNIASKYILESFGNIFLSYQRQHDISDTILFTLYWSNLMHLEKERQKLHQKRKQALKKYNKGLGMSLDDFFDTFRYIPQKNI